MKKFTIKCENCGAEYSKGELFISFINTSHWDDVEEGKLIITCNKCKNEGKIEI